LQENILLLPPLQIELISSIGVTNTDGEIIHEDRKVEAKLQKDKSN
jgi:hypothetical protein